MSETYRDAEKVPKNTYTKAEVIILIHEAIGDDEKGKPIRNNLRKEQRNNIKEIFK